MTGPVSMFAIAAMNRRAEEALIKVRTELFRIGCAPQNLQIQKQGDSLQLRFQHQIILADTAEVLGILEKIPSGQAEAVVWAKVVTAVRQPGRNSLRPITWSIVTVTITIVLILLWTLVRR